MAARTLLIDVHQVRRSQDLCNIVLAEIAAIGGEGGLIALNTKGEYTMRFNTRGMFRGVIRDEGIARVEIF